MLEHIIDSLSFRGKTDHGGFTPLPKAFSAPHELVFSAARVTVIGSSVTSGRTYDTRLSITVSPSGTYVNSLWGDASDREPTTMGAFSRLSRLFPQFEYQLDVTCYGFGTDDEDVTVRIDLLELDTTVAEVTRDVLRKSESTQGVKAMTFGISEASFAHFMTAPLTNPEVEIGSNSHLKMRISVGSNNFPYWPFVYIDTVSKEFVISGSLLLTVVRSNDGGDVAFVSMALKVHGEPAMVTDSQDSFQIQFRRAEVVEGSLMITYVDSTISDILGGFPSIPDFEEAVNGYLAQITSNTGPLGFTIPAYLASRPMPDQWDHVQNMVLKFEGFSYETVQVHSLPVSYLFITFSVQSLGLPAPCYCEDELFPNLAAQDPVLDVRPPVKKGTHKWASPDRTDYSRFLAAAQISAFGLSEQTFHEIAQPYATFSHMQSTSTNGTIYASARFWYTTRLIETQITSTGVKAILDATGEGSAKAAVRDKCRHDVLSASTKLRISIDQSSITFTLNIFEQLGNPPEISIEAVPVADLGHVDVNFSTPFDPPPPLDQIRNWILESVLTLVGETLIKILNKDPRMRLIQTVENNGNIRLKFVDNKFFEREAVVLLAQLYDRSWS